MIITANWIPYNQKNDLNIAIKKILRGIVGYAHIFRDSIYAFLKSKESSFLIDLKRFLDYISVKYSIFFCDLYEKYKNLLDICTQVFIITELFCWIKYQKMQDTRLFSFNKLIDLIPNNELLQDFSLNFYNSINPKVRNDYLNCIELFLQKQQITINSIPLIEIYSTLYSDFLQLYDPKTWKALGVVYTPLFIVDFMVKGIDWIIETQMGLAQGILNSTVSYLDPSAGTLAFPCSLLSIAAQKFRDLPKTLQYDFSTFKDWFQNAFILRFCAFELSLIPYLLGQLKLGLIAGELDNDMNMEGLKLRFFQINTLLPKTQLTAIQSPALKQKAEDAIKIRDTESIRVILGNPPYNVSAQNKFAWIASMVEDYKVGAQKIHSGSKKITSFKSLQNDYIKFVRLAQWIITERQQSGLIAFITPNTYLNDLSTRGMRQSLYEHFDMIWIIDLHGDVRRGIPYSQIQKGVTKDENIFEIKQGVCLNFLLKFPPKNNTPNNRKAQVKYCEVWGTKAEKQQFLTQSFETLPYTVLQPSEMNEFLFLPDEFHDRDQYRQFFGLNEIFRENIQGIVTGHDALVSHPDRSILELNITHFYDGTFAQKETIDSHTKRRQFHMNGIRYQDVRDWSIEEARQGHPETEKQKIIPFMWRGFDRVWLVYSRYLLNGGTDRYPTMQYLLPHQKNLGLVVTRHSFRSAQTYSSCFISNVPISDGAIEGRIPCYIFPLAVNTTSSKDDFDHPKPAVSSNILESFLQHLPYRKEITDRNVLEYIYGVLYSPSYRRKYIVGLSQDFPRIPFPNTLSLFKAMAVLGKQLIELHLLESPEISIEDWSHSRSPNRKIISPYYDSALQRIYFDKVDTYSAVEPYWIGQITPEMWQFEIGGINQLDQWLKNRRFHLHTIKGHIPRGLTDDEVHQFLKICAAIRHTLTLIPSIDNIYRQIEEGSHVH